jgi:hypothetical protein
MAIISLSFENKNQFRKYPLKQSVSLKALDGFTLPDGLLVNASITSVLNKHRIYIKQIHRIDSTIKITITSILDDVTLGTFEGLVSSDYTTLYFNPFERFLSGTLTIGSLEALNSLPNILNFEPDASEFEESVIYCYTPPKVTSIRDAKNSELRGVVNYGILTGLTKTSDPQTKTTKLRALNPLSVFNLADKSSLLQNCSTPLIKNINGVKPSSISQDADINPHHENDGNIYIAGIRPVIFYKTQGNQMNWRGVWKDIAYTVNDAVTYEKIPYICKIPTIAEQNQNPGNSTRWEPVSGAGTLAVSTEGVTMEGLCAQKSKLLPPVDVSGFSLNLPMFKDLYYSKPAMPAYDPYKPINPDPLNPNYPIARPARLAGSFYNTEIPEYYFWPQFAKEEYYQDIRYWTKP